MQKNSVSLKEEFAIELKSSLLKFTQFFYKLLTGRDFIVSAPLGRESHHITICKALTKAFRLELDNQRLIINTPPGSGKSTLMTMFVAWTMCQYPDSKYIYVSYSKTLADKMTEQIKRIMSLREYEELFNVSIRRDSKAKDYFQTTAGGAVASAGSGGTITGLSAAEPGLDRFSGALICFPRDELIYTERGVMKIGDIVEQHIDVRVYSFNLQTREVELKEIERYFENPGSDLVEIVFDDNSTLRCTPDHKVWTDNRGWIEAQDLLSADQLLSISGDSVSFNSGDSCCFCDSNVQIENNLSLICTKSLKRSSWKAMLNSQPLSVSLYSMSVDAKFFRQIANFHACVFQSLYLMLCQSFKFIKTPLRSKTFSSFCPSAASPNFLNRKNRKSVIFCNNSRSFFCHSPLANFNSLLRCDFSCTCIKIPVSNHVVNIVFPSSVSKIFNSIVVTISVQMSNLKTSLFGAYKRFSNNAVNRLLNPFTGKIQTNIKIPLPLSIFSRLPGLQNLFFKNLSAIFRDCTWLPMDNPGLTSDPSIIRNAVKTFKTRNISPLFIRKIGHVDKTYCLTVKDNHNMFMGINGVITSNCDDLHKPDEVFSQTLREKVISNFSQTLVQRLRSLKAPIIMIGQRLHEADISQYVIDSKDGYDWTKVIIKAIDEANNIIYPEVYSKEMLERRKATDAYVFSSQYQQEPVPAGGALFKPDWFVMLDEEPAMLCTFVIADTAETSKTYNDATAISFFGVYKLEDGSLAIHWIDALEVHVEPRELKETFTDFWNTCMRYKTKPKFAAIEKKSTGVTLISTLQEIRGIRIIDIARSSASGSKTKRFLDAQPFVAERRISFSRYAKHANKCIEHMAKITANDSHARDDLADNLADAIRMTFVDKTIVYSVEEETDYNELSKDLMSNSFHIAALRAKAYNSR